MARSCALADKGVYFGTSSWKYEGWVGSIYTKERYLTRGKFSQKKFEAECLAEYAATFPAVCGDFSFYRFPTVDTWKEVLGAVPSGLVFGLKVPETMTVAKWPGHARYGQRAGKLNEHFLDAALFETAFIRLLQPYRDRVAVLIFEFGHFSKKEFPHTADFFKRLDGFLGVLPTGWRYGVEIRNDEYLGDDYFAVAAPAQRRSRLQRVDEDADDFRADRHSRSVHGRFRGGAGADTDGHQPREDG